MVSSGGSGTSSAPNIPAPSGQLNPTPGGAPPSYPSFLGNLGPGGMASGLTPEMLAAISGSGFQAAPPGLQSPQAAPMAPPPGDKRAQLARAMQQQQQQMGLSRNGAAMAGGYGGGFGGSDAGGGRSSRGFGGRAAGGRGAY